MSEAHGHWQLQAGGTSKKHTTKTYRDDYFPIFIVYIILSKKIIVLVSVQNT